MAGWSAALLAFALLVVACPGPAESVGGDDGGAVGGGGGGTGVGGGSGGNGGGAQGGGVGGGAGGGEQGGGGDAGAIDAGLSDAGAGASDGGVTDAGEADAGTGGGEVDAGGNASDAGSSGADAGTADAGPVDAGPVDAGATDAGATDAGAVDAGAVDAGSGPAGADCAGGYLNSDAGNACPLSCSAAVTPIPEEGVSHVPLCTVLSYQHDPPASGPHWLNPAPWGVHDWVVPRSWWVHNLEHGGVVLLYNCPGGDGGTPITSCDGGVTPPSPNGCPAEIAQLAQLYWNHPLDQWSEVRILVTGDPLLPTRFAAIAWDWTLSSDTLDVAAVQCFIDARYGRGPENAP